MDTHYTKIANLKVLISQNCTDNEKEIINFYWEVKDTEIVNSPKKVTTTFGIDFTALKTIIKTHSEMSLYLFCEHCKSYEFQKINSSTNFNALTRLKRQRDSHLNFKCLHCTRLEEIKATIAKKEANEKFLQKFENAIECKNWNNLNNFERDVLSDCLEMNFSQLANKYGGVLGKEGFIKLIRALEKIASQYLIRLIRNSNDNYIASYQCFPKLFEFKEEIKVPVKKSLVYNKMDTMGNELRFKLTINEHQYHPDSPMHAGTVTFKERIVIEPDVEYIFGLWQRAHENLYLTMTPLEKLQKLPIQKRINSQPVLLRQAMIDYLNNLGKDL